jgi:two-component system, cell cycle sensor histidine kinase and response regulator CckA
LLTVIGGLSTMTLPELAEGGAGRQNLQQVIRAAERATALTQQLLTFSRRQIAEVKALDLNVTVTGLEALLRRLIGEHIALEIMLAHDLGRVRANEVQIEQIIMNLVLNARDAMPEGGTLAVATHNVEVTDLLGREQLRLSPGPYVMFAVSDTGAGMDAVTQASIFEPFFTTKRAGEGTGLGLATVYAIVQQAGGAIYVYSEPGLGSTFKVYLPRIDVPVELAGGLDSVVPAATPRAPGGLVLVTEDEPGVRSFAAQVLRQAGYRVLEAANGQEALDRATGQTEPITLLLTDVVMPGMTGRVLAERMRALYPGVAVLYMSGYTDDMVLRAGVMVDGRNYLQKPFTPEGLLARVRSTMAPFAPHVRG